MLYNIHFCFTFRKSASSCKKARLDHHSDSCSESEDSEVDDSSESSVYARIQLQDNLPRKRIKSRRPSTAEDVADSKQAKLPKSCSLSLKLNNQVVSSCSVSSTVQCSPTERTPSSSLSTTSSIRCPSLAKSPADTTLYSKSEPFKENSSSVFAKDGHL